MSVILGIHDGHDCSAALMVDGCIVAAAQEERFSGLKLDYGFPKHAIDFCLKQAGLSKNDVEYIALSGRQKNPVLSYLKRNAQFSVEDWVKEQNEYWWPLLYENRRVDYFNIYKDRSFTYDKYYSYDGLIQAYMDQDNIDEFLRRRLHFFSEYLGLDSEQIRITNHENNHKYWGVMASDLPIEEPILLIHSEGLGDKYNGSVSVWENGEIKILANMRQNHLGHIYQYVTLILGMRPNQDEYKVMGLAPYANNMQKEKALKVFRKYLKVDGLQVVFNVRPRDLYFAVKKDLDACRFDGIAAGAQAFLEEILCELTRNAIDETGIGNVVYGGGVAQNIKAMQAVSRLDEVDYIFAPPAAGDTSNSVGACYNLAFELRRNGENIIIKKPSTIYLGPEFADFDVSRLVRDRGLNGELFIERKVNNHDIARLLADGKILGLCRGRMEFGLRALGNRSILADPVDPLIVDSLNAKVKFRDFWMPFTPAIIDYRADEYFYNTKRLNARYMTMAFESKPEKRRDFPAAMHPADKTVRPSVITQEMNPEFYGLLKAFEELTGRGVILNTSFNLHGKPIVLGPEEALTTLLHSELDGVVIGDCLVRRKE